MGCSCGHCNEENHHHGHEQHHAHSHGCACCDHHEESERRIFLRIIVGTGLLLLGVFLPVKEWVRTELLLLALIAVGYPLFFSAAKNLIKGRFMDEMFLMAIAAIGAFCIGEYFEGVMVMLLYTVGEYFQDRAVEKSRKSIADAMDLRPDMARIWKENKWQDIAPEKAEIGDLLLVYPGEKIPLDGVIEAGASSLDTAALTGESVPRDVKEGERVISGCVNLSATLKIRVTQIYHDSTVFTHFGYGRACRRPEIPDGSDDYPVCQGIYPDCGGCCGAGCGDSALVFRWNLAGMDS